MIKERVCKLPLVKQWQTALMCLTSADFAKLRKQHIQKRQCIDGPQEVYGQRRLRKVGLVTKGVATCEVDGVVDRFAQYVSEWNPNKAAHGSEDNNAGRYCKDWKRT